MKYDIGVVPTFLAFKGGDEVTDVSFVTLPVLAHPHFSGSALSPFALLTTKCHRLSEQRTCSLN